MSSMYIHIPFCKQKCHYCNFFTTVSLKNKDRIVDSICKELRLKRNFLSSNKLTTLYFGGGTPSLLSNKDFDLIFAAIHKYYTIDDDTEITVEANPEDLNKDKLLHFKQLGINRLSIGTQSFNDEILHQLNRNHSSKEAINSIVLAKELGFNNLNIDLIYGVPGLTENCWEDTLNTFLSLDISHLSAYSLTLEPKTTLDFLIRNKRYPPLREKDSLVHWKYLLNFIKNNNYEQYEISNFCKNSFYSRHNTNYWKQKEYLGIGPAAHSFNLVSRQWNIAQIEKYIQDIDNNINFNGSELLTKNDAYNEFVMLGLRTKWGFSLKEVKKRFGDNGYNYCLTIISTDSFKKYLLDNTDKVILNEEGLKIADKLASELFIV